MKSPAQITFRKLRRSVTVVARIHERAEKLNKYYQYITGCHVLVEAIRKPPQRGCLYHVLVDISIPGSVNNTSAEYAAYKDVYLAIREAFYTVERRLKEYACRQGSVPTHALLGTGEIIYTKTEPVPTVEWYPLETTAEEVPSTEDM